MAERDNYEIKDGVYDDILGKMDPNDLSNDISDDLSDDLAEVVPMADIINIFLIYYKQLFNKSNSSTMFDDIDNNKDVSTNRCMEMLYEHIYKFNQAEADSGAIKKEDKTMLIEHDDRSTPVDIEKFEELYLLKINKKQFMCELLLPIIIYIAETDDWIHTNWAIIPIKSDSI